MPKYLLAHDLGTSGNKATLFTTEGELIRSSTRAYPTRYYNGNWAEQDPEDWWKAVCDSSRDLLAAGNPAKPDMQSILRRNARDLVLGNAILVSSADAKELEFGVHMAYSDADGGFDTDPSEDVWFEASSLPIPNERPDLPPDNALRIRVTDVLTEYGFTDIDVKAPDRTPEGIWIGFEAMQPVRLDVTSARGGRSVSFTLTAAEAND